MESDQTQPPQEEGSEVPPLVRLEGRTLGSFIVREKLGEGGFGTVFRAEQPVLGREAVIKVLRDNHQRNEEIIQRFRREARLASQLEHPYTAHVYAFGAEPDGLLWIAMELVHGTPLDRLLKTQGPLPLPRLVPLLDKICEVVHTAHEHGIVHRDIKPANVMVIARAGRLLPKLLDFGIAKGLRSELAQVAWSTAVQSATAEQPHGDSGELALSEPPTASLGAEDRPPTNTPPPVNYETIGAMGSPPYMAPEQWVDSGAADSRADIYSLGVLTYEALTGRPPFWGDVGALCIAHAHDSVPPLGPEFPAAIYPVMAKVMAKRVADRYQTALEFAVALREAANLSEHPPELPQMEELLRDQLTSSAPHPIAEAVANLKTARNIHQARDRALDVLRISTRYVALSALACQAQIASPGTPGEQVASALRELRRGGLSSEQWAELAMALCRPFAHQRDAHPIPELVSFFFANDTDKPSRNVRILSQLWQMEKSLLHAGASEEHLRRSVQRYLGELGALLRALAFVSDYPLVVPRGNHLEEWMGVGRARSCLRQLSGRVAEPDHPVLLSAQGDLLVSLWPLVQLDAPVPGVPKELFWLDGADRKGARLLALPNAFERHDEAPWEWFRAHFFDLEGQRVQQPDREAVPYLGLSVFTPGDEALFFGREKEAEGFLNRLLVQPLLAVVGPSGAGKSSFVQAGVIPGLPGAARVIIVRPGVAPLQTLASRLLKENIGTPELRRALGRDPLALGSALRAAAESQGCTLVLIIDQFEELFTLCAAPDEQQLYAQALACAAVSAEEPVRIILTLRDDFLVRAKELPGLRDRLAHCLELLATPDEQDLLRILIEPTRRLGYEFEDRELPGEMIAAVRNRPGALPLLAFTAAKLWELRDRQFQQLRRKTYEAMGGVGGALARHAEETLEQMPAADRRLVREAFRRLVTSEGTRATISRPDLVQVLHGGIQAAAVVERLIAARLLTASEGEGGIERIEVVHEALLVAWPRLVEWRRQDREGARLRDQLGAAARQWDERGQPRGLLWRDESLVELRLWRARYDGKLTQIEEAFAAASFAAAARGRRQQLAAAGLAVGTLLLVLLVLVAEHRQTRSQLLQLYEEQGRQQLLLGNRDRALVYLSEAYQGGSDSPSLRFLLGQALLQFNAKPPLSLAGHRSAVRSAMFSRDGRVLTAGTDDSAKIWDGNTGALLRSIDDPVDGIHTATISPDGRRIVTAGFAKARIWDSATGQHLGDLVGHLGRVNGASFSSDGRFLVTAGIDGTARVWDNASGRHLKTLLGHSQSVYGAVFSPDSRRIVTASADETAIVWDAITFEKLHTLSGHSAAVYGIAFRSDGERIVTASADSSAKIWDAKTGVLLQSLDEHKSMVNSAVFSPDGKRIVTASVDRTAKVWDAGTGRLLLSLPDDHSMINSAAFSPEGERIVTASQHPIVKIWFTDLARQRPDEVAHVTRTLVPLRIGEGAALVPTVPQAMADARPPSAPAAPQVAPKKPIETPSPAAHLSMHDYKFETVRLGPTGALLDSRQGQGREFTEALGNGVTLDMVAIAGGTFFMGSPDMEGESEEHPRHQVIIAPFFIGKFEVTQAQWRVVMGDNPSYFRGDELPIESVTWHQAMEFCERLSRLTGRDYRLPTEAEWEYACRAGTDTAFGLGDILTTGFANYAGNNPYGAAPPGEYRRRTTKVGTVGRPNGFGLYDMHGNVFEWCLDPFNDQYWGAPSDGHAWELDKGSAFRVLRGGAWRWGSYYARSAYRRRFPPESFGNDLGFRLVLPATQAR